MNRLIIVGAGGMGREVLSWARHINSKESAWEIAGFLDSDPHALDRFEIDISVIGAPEDYMPKQGDLFVCGIGDPQARLKVSRELMLRGAEFITLVHPSAVIGCRVEIGIGVIIGPLACVTCDVQLGDFVFMNVNSSVGHDAVIGEGCTLSGHADVTGNVELGKGVFLGTHACVHPGVKVEDFAVIGIATAAMRNVPEKSTILGVPGKKVPVV